MPSDLPHADELPDALTDREQWLCWREEQRGDKPTKVPIDPHTGSYGSATDPESWADFETARAYAVDGAADGLGFVFSDDDPLVGVDLDDCRDPEREHIIHEAVDIVEQLASYTEISPSGTGVHVLVEGELHGDRNRREWIECYETARYFTVTGDHLDGTPLHVEERTSELHDVYVEYLQEESERADEADADGIDDDGDEGDADGTDDDGDEGDADAPGEDTASSDGAASTLSDEELLDRAHAAANGEKFARLWTGDTSGYESHSEADMALCALLAFWTGGDAERIDRLFRQSGLMREKWDERHYADGSTYGEVTIERVLASADEFYDPDYAEQEGDTWTDTADAPDGGEEVLRTIEQEQATIRARTTEPIVIVAELQKEVERLDAECQRLEAELDACREARAEAETDSNADTERADTPSSFTDRLRQWLTATGEEDA
ncbi:MAG: hypothetical protein ABEI11_02055 [Haloarculaceae archaeon]